VLPTNLLVLLIIPVFDRRRRSFLRSGMVVFSGGYFDGVFAGLLGSVKGLVGPAGYLVRGVVRAILAEADAY